MDTQPIKVNYLPSKGLNTYIDRALLTHEACYTCSNVFLDKGSMTVREGIVRTTYSGQLTGFANALIVANYDDIAAKTYAADDNATTITLKYYNSGSWSDLTNPAGISISSLSASGAAPRGTFIQYRDDVYFTNGTTIPLCIYDPATTPSVRKAGIDSAEAIKIIDELNSTSADSWTAESGLTETIDYNQNHFIIGNAGIMISTALTGLVGWYRTYAGGTLNLSTDVYESSYNATDNDYIAFYLYRYEKANVANLQLIFTDTNDYTATADIIGTTYTGLSGFSNPRTFACKWDNDYTNYKMFFVKIRRGWFDLSNTSFSWAAIKEVRFKLKATTSGTARVTLDYLHMRTSEPTPQATGLLISGMEGSNDWSGATRSYVYATEGMYCIKIAPGTTATYTPASHLDLKNWGDGNTTTQRDILKLNVTVQNVAGSSYIDLGAAFPILTLTFTDTDGTTATTSWVLSNYKYIYPGGVTTRTLQRYMLTGLITYSAGTFDTFHWESIHSVAIGVSGSGTSWYVYCDQLRIERGAYQKYVASFTPGIRDYLSSGALMDQASTLLQGIPYASTIISGIQALGEYSNNFGKYKTVGQGWFQMPYRDHAELNLGGYASLLIGAGSDKQNNLWGVANSALTDDVEGFRVGLPFPRLYGSTTPALNDYSRYWLWEDAFSSTDVTMTIDDDDYCRCWVWISDPTALSRIVFRMYTDDKTTGGGWTQDPNFYNFNIRHNDLTNGVATYWEYVWNAASLPNLEALEARRRYNAEEKNSQESWEKFLDVAGQTIQNNKLPDGTPEIVKQGVDAVKNFEIGGKNILDLLGYPELAKQGKEKEKGVTTVLKWRKRDFTYRGSSSLSTSVWTTITGISIEVIPQPGMSVECAFDNWYFYRGGALNGNYWYTYTWVDKYGIESVPSAPSEMFTANNTDVILSYIPTVWPNGTDSLNIYRMGGTVPDWRLVGTIGKPATGASVSNFTDRKADVDVGRSLVFFGYAPPKAKVMSLVGDRMLYANGIDRYGKTKPSRIWISEQYLPGACKDEMIRDIAPSDGTEITGIVNFRGFIVVFKERSIWTLDGDDFTPVIRVPNIGCIAPKSIAVAKDYILFLSHEGIAIFNIADVSTNIGLPIKNTFTAIIEAGNISYLTDAISFIYGDYYWIFYDSDNTLAKNAFAFHMPSNIWTAHSFKIGAATYLDVKSACIDIATNKLLVGSQYDSSGTYVRSVLNFYPGSGVAQNDDCGVEIASSFESGDVDFNTESNAKRLHAYYVRGKRITTNASYTITPYVEEAHCHKENGTTTLTLTRDQTGGNGINALTTAHTTQIHLPNLGVDGYIHRMAMTGTGRYSLSALQAIYHVMPERVK